MRDRIHAADGCSALRTGAGGGTARTRRGVSSGPSPAETKLFPMTLTPDQIQSIAQLARLEVKPAEAAAYATSLTSILGLVGQLEKADTAGSSPWPTR